MSIINLNEIEKNSKETCDRLKQELNIILSHRALPDAFIHLRVDGSPLRSMASVSSSSNSCITITPFDRQNLRTIEEVVRKVSGYKMSVKGDVMYLEIMPLYKEVIEKKIKEANTAKENSLIKLRQIRQNALNIIKKEKSGVSENIIKKQEKDVEKIISDYSQIIKNLSTNVT